MSQGAEELKQADLGDDNIFSRFPTDTRKSIPLPFSQAHDAMQEDYSAYKCPYNPFISVEVSNPIWSNEGTV